MVPTWNYAVVHVYGTFEAVQDRAETVNIVSRIVDYYESFEPRAWTADFDSPYNRKMIRGVTAFRIKIARVEGKWKMGQNRPAYLRRRALEELQARPGENETGCRPTDGGDHRPQRGRLRKRPALSLRELLQGLAGGFPLGLLL